jgi:hypothetical protein
MVNKENQGEEVVETVNINNFRFYRIGEQWLPSVTSVISIIPSPAIEKWKELYTTAQVEEILEYTSHRGVLIHFSSLKQYETSKITQGEIENESVEYFQQHPQMKDELLVAAKLFHDFRRKYQLIPVALEKCVYNLKYGYAGRVDGQFFLINQNGSKTSILVDIKTSKTIYADSVSKQLSAYNKCLGGWAEKLFILLLHPGKTQINGIEIGADKPCWLFQEVTTDFHGFLDRLKLFKSLKLHLLAYD